MLEVPAERAAEGRPAVRVRVRWLAVPPDALLTEDVGVVGTGEVILGLQADQDGVVRQVRATRGPGAESWTLALELTTVELDRPLAVRTLRLGGLGAPLTIQAPSGILRRLRCGASQATDEALLLGGAALGSASRTAGTPLVLVELDPLEPGDEAIALR